jgi:hypothetical protein
MPTLEELFKSKQLESQGGKTAQEVYAIRNGNNIPLSSNSPVINATTMKAVNLLRRNNGSTLRERVFEQETTGIRILGTLSQPLLYGPELGRMVLRETLPLSEMKAETSGVLPSGPIGKAFKSVRTFATKTLGIPSLATPTFTKNFSDPIKGSLETTNSIQKDYQGVLQNIKDSSQGSLLGRLLKGGIGSLTDPSQLGSKVIGEAMKFGKGLLRDKLVGGGNAPSQNNYDFDNFPGFANGVKIVRNYGSNTQNNLLSATSAGTSLTTFNSSLPNFVSDSGKFFDAGGSSYSSFFKPSITTVETKNFGILGKETSTFALPSKFVQKSDDAEENREFGLLKNSPFPDIELNKQINRAGKLSKGQIEKRKQNLDNFSKNKNNESSYGIAVNTSGVYKESDGLNIDNTPIDELDTVPLKFTSIHRGRSVNFLSTITGLTETLSPSWDSGKFIGSPFSYYTYSGIERSVSFNFKVFSLNAEEHKAGWDKINFLNTLVFPQGFYSESSAIVPPFIKFTMGDLYKGKFAFIESLSHTWSESTPWEINKKVDSISNEGVDMEGYRLPMITDVSITIKFLESRSTTQGRRLYSFTPQTS